MRVTEMIESFKIFFSDLTVEAQRRFLDHTGLKSAEEGNYDIYDPGILEMW